MLRRVERLRGVIFNYAPFAAMLYLYFFHSGGGIELIFTSVFLACNYYFARTLYLSKHREQ